MAANPRENVIRVIQNVSISSSEGTRQIEARDFNPGILTVVIPGSAIGTIHLIGSSYYSTDKLSLFKMSRANCTFFI